MPSLPLITETNIILNYCANSSQSQFKTRRNECNLSRVRNKINMPSNARTYHTSLRIKCSPFLLNLMMYDKFVSANVCLFPRAWFDTNNLYQMHKSYTSPMLQYCVVQEWINWYSLDHLNWPMSVQNNAVSSEVLLDLTMCIWCPTTGSQFFVLLLNCFERNQAFNTHHIFCDLKNGWRKWAKNHLATVDPWEVNTCSLW